NSYWTIIFLGREMSKTNNRMVNGRLIEFITKDKVLLQGLLLGPSRSKTCVVYIHGMTGNFYGGNLQFSMASDLERIGVSLFSINTRGHDAVSVMRKIKGRETE